MYTAADFNTENAPKEMVQYIIDNVDDFESRYQHALSIIGRDRCPLRMADPILYDDILDAGADWIVDNDTSDGSEFPEYDIEEIFG